MSLAVETARERRKTAGLRMTDLVGKAAEEDDEFWGHDTWAEGADSGNESFHASDEDSELNKDEFDSDFNDSETDREDEEQEAGNDEEAELKRAEKSSNQRSSNYVDIAQAGRELMQKKKGKGKKRVVGDGINAGIVLNFPSGQPPITGLQLAQVQPVSVPISPSKIHTKPKSHPSSAITLASSRRRRSHYSPRQLRETRSTLPSDAKLGNHGKSTKRKKRKRYVQEELLLEAVNETEPENIRWLLARKRVQDLVEKDKEAMSQRDAASGKIIEKYHSRRGCLITLTFPEMDSVPEILTRPKVELTKSSPTYCAVTGKRAIYRDPLTKLGYFDAAAFKELRRRHSAGEVLATVVPVKKMPSSQIEGKNGGSINGGSAQLVEKYTQMVDALPAATKSSPLMAVRPSDEAAGETSTGDAAGASVLSMHSEVQLDRETDDKDTPSSCGSPRNGRARINSADKIPDSPMGRRSTRKWKPSSKLLQNIVLADRKAVAAAGALTIRIESESDEPAEALGVLPIKKLRRGKVRAGSVSEMPEMPGLTLGLPDNIVSDSTKEAATDGSQPASAQSENLVVSGATNGLTGGDINEKPAGTIVSPALTQTIAELKAPSPSDHLPQTSKVTMAATGNDTHVSTGEAREKLETDKRESTVAEDSPIADNSKIPQEETQSAPMGSVRTEPVYLVHSEGTDSTEGKQPPAEPRYITQSELIMEAIHTYSRRQEERERSNSLSKS